MDSFLHTFDFSAYSEYGMLGALFLMLMGGTFGLPYPEDLLVIWAGILVHQGKIGAIHLFVVCWAAVMLGDTIMYLVGRLFGVSILDKPFFARMLKEERINAAREFLENKRLITIIVARHLFYLRGATFFCCGLLRMRFASFFLADGLAASINLPIVICLGYYGSEYVPTPAFLAEKLKAESFLIGLVAVSVVLVWFLVAKLISFFKRRRVLEESSSRSV